MLLKALKSALQHLGYRANHGSISDLIRDDLLVIQIQYWREVNLLAFNIELSDIGDPLLIGLASCKVTLQ